jgi:diphosphomevalonate decarboxylase
VNRSEVVNQILKNADQDFIMSSVTQFAPSNIALVKYWGKRNAELNLPMTSSLSISLGEKGTETTIDILDAPKDQIFLNEIAISNEDHFAKRLVAFLDLFRTPKNYHFKIQTKNNIPTGAGLASSASGFAALVLGLNKMFDWQLPKKELSILARMGSGSACRSLWQGFVKWHCGERDDGLDSYAEKLPYEWPELRVGLLVISEKEKFMGSREAMNRTVKTSKLYQSWPGQVAQDLKNMEEAIKNKDFDLLGKTAEENAIAMHATMHDAVPSINYDLPETVELKNKIWQLRKEGLPLYFTQDAGPNIKLLFLQSHLEKIKTHFEKIEMA